MNNEKLNELMKVRIDHPELDVFFVYEDADDCEGGKQLEITNIKVDFVCDTDDVTYPNIGEANIRLYKEDLIENGGFTEAEANDYILKNRVLMIVVTMFQVV